MFKAQIDCFKDKYNLILPDIIGHGDSIDTQKGDSINKMSYWINEILKKENINKVHIVGISLGAVLAQDFANKYPEAILSLACFGGYDINNFDRSLQKKNSSSHMGMMLKAVFSVKWFAKTNKKISAYTAKAQEDFYEMNTKFHKKSFMYLASINTMVNAHKSSPKTYPLMIGCGQHDIADELSAVKMWSKSEPQCKVVIFGEAGHCVNMDVPEKFNKVLEEFWSSNSSITCEQ